MKIIEELLACFVIYVSGYLFASVLLILAFIITAPFGMFNYEGALTGYMMVGHFTGTVLTVGYIIQRLV